MEDEETIIFPDSPEAAKETTVTGWVSRNGLLYGKDECAARYAGATHTRVRGRGPQRRLHALPAVSVR